MTNKLSTGIYFSLSLRTSLSLQHVSQQVSKALEFTLEENNERGLKGDYIGRCFGLRIDLFSSRSDDYLTDEGALYEFIGKPEYSSTNKDSWVDISEYIMQSLQIKTQLPWSRP